MSEYTYGQSAIEYLKELPLHQPPWQLLMVGNTQEPLRFTADTSNALKRIFDLLPSLGGLTIETTKGDLTVSRDFPSGYMEAVDNLIAAIFENEPEITGIVFPATSTRPEHTATADDPHFLPEGKTIAAITAARKAGEIDSEEALRRLKAIHSNE